MASSVGQDTLLRRIIRAQSRFRSIARSDGVAVALIKCAAKVRKKLDDRGRALAAWIDMDVRRLYAPPPRLDPYDAWRRVNRDNPRRRRLIEAALKSPTGEPRFCVIVPVYNPPIDVFRAMIGSVLDQTIADWELVLVNDARPDAQVRSELGVLVEPVPAHPRDRAAGER